MKLKRSAIHTALFCYIVKLALELVRSWICSNEDTAPTTAASTSAIAKHNCCGRNEK